MAFFDEIATISFRSISAKRELRQLTLLVGPIGSGKSNTEDAITTAVLGRNRLTDAKGAGLDQDILYGGKEFTVTLKGRDAAGKPFSIKRRKTASAHQLEFINGEASFSGSIAHTQGAIHAMLGLSPEVLGALLDARLIVEKSPEEQVIVMRKLLRSQGEIALPESARKLGIGGLDSVDGLNNAIKNLTERRKVANKAVKDGVGKIPDPVDVGVVDYDAELRSNQDRMQRAGSEQARVAERMRSALEFEKTQPLEFDQARLSEVIKRAMERKAAIDQGKAFYEKQRLEWSKLDVKDGAAQEAARAFEEVSEFCNTCHRKITSAQRKDILASLKEAAESSHAKAEEQAALMGETKLNLEALIDEQRALQPEYEALTKAKSSHEAYESMKLAQGSVNTEALSRELQDIGRTMSELQQVADALSEKHRVWRDGVAQKRLRKELLEKSDALQVERSAVEGALQDLIAVRDGLLTGDRVKTFIDGINEFGHDLGLQEVSYGDGESLMLGGHEPKRGSSGQRMLLELGFRIQAAKLTGLGVLVIDDINRLGELLRGKVTAKILASGVQAIIAATTDKADKIVMPKELEDRVAIYRLS